MNWGRFGRRDHFWWREPWGDGMEVGQCRVIDREQVGQPQTASRLRVGPPELPGTGYHRTGGGLGTGVVAERKCLDGPVPHFSS